MRTTGRIGNENRTDILTVTANPNTINALSDIAALRVKIQYVDREEAKRILRELRRLDKQIADRFKLGRKNNLEK